MRRRTMMRKHWTTRFALGAAVCAATGLLGVPGRADDKGGAFFKQKCAVCHGADGKGDTPAGKNTKMRNFADPEVAKQSDEELAGVIEKGKNKMPAYGKSLKPDEIKALVACIRTLVK
jgi:cytochrome c6